MAQKHYNISYLEDTAKLLKNLKEHSYEPFRQVNEGIVADLGCGTGIDVINMAKILGEQTKVIGIDHDPEMIGKARSSAGETANVEFIVSEVSPLTFEENMVSGIRAERLFQHLKNSPSVIAEIRRVLQPGAPVVIVETDWQSLSFYNGDTNVEKKITQYLTEVKINNGFAARTLTQYLAQGSFSNIRLELFPFVLKSLKEACDYLWIDRIVNEMAEKNYISSLEKDSFMDALQAADALQHFGCAINIVVVSAKK